MAYSLIIFSPNGQEYSKREFSKLNSSLPRTITIGRTFCDDSFPKNIRIKLPAEDKTISRRHCTLEFKQDYSVWVTSQSTHLTYLRKANSPQNDNLVINEKNTGYRLRSGDEILILSKFPASTNPYWVCCFNDTEETEPIAPLYPYRIKYGYYLTSKKLLAWTSVEQRKEIQFTGQRLDLIHYLAKKIDETRNTAYLASHEEIIRLLWPGNRQFGFTPENIRPLVSRINKDLEECGKDAPRLIESVRGHGYRLNNCSVTP